MSVLYKWTNLGTVSIGGSLPRIWVRRSTMELFPMALLPLVSFSFPFLLAMVVMDERYEWLMDEWYQSDGRWIGG